MRTPSLISADEASRILHRGLTWIHRRHNRSACGIRVVRHGRDVLFYERDVRRAAKTTAYRYARAGVGGSLLSASQPTLQETAHRIIYDIARRLVSLHRLLGCSVE